MNAQKILALFAVVTLIFSGCSSKEKHPAPPKPPTEEASSNVLNETSWLLETLRGQTVKPGSTLNFDKGQARGSAGCNSYSGPYFERAQGKFHVELAVMTKKQCSPPDIMQQEQRFTEAIKAAVTYKIANGKLMLKDVAGTALAVLKAQSQELKGTSWKVTRFSDGQGGMTDALSKGRTLTATFGAGGQLSGFGGCNNYIANYTASTSVRTFSFEMILMTTKQCQPDAVMEQEGSFMSALYMAVSYRIEGDVLTLNNADGNSTVILQRKSFQ